MWKKIESAINSLWRTGCIESAESKQVGFRLRNFWGVFVRKFALERIPE